MHRPWKRYCDSHWRSNRIRCHLLHDARCKKVSNYHQLKSNLRFPGRGTADASAIEHGRIGQETLAAVFWCYWCHLFNRCDTKTILAGNVHHWRYEFISVSHQYGLNDGSSVTGCCRDPRGLTNCHNCYSRTGCTAHGQAQSDRQKITLCRVSRISFRNLLR